VPRLLVGGVAMVAGIIVLLAGWRLRPRWATRRMARPPSPNS
jgi:hypothetical protein